MRLTKAQERLLAALLTKKGRIEHGKFVVEGVKFVKDAGRAVEFTFTPQDTPRFREFVSTESPQPVAAVVAMPTYGVQDIAKMSTIVVLDGVQDPGNVGAVLRACLGFKAGLLLVECADVTNPKTVRSSASAVLRVPWMTVSRSHAEHLIAGLRRPVFRLELRPGSKPSVSLPDQEPIVIVAGSEGSGIRLDFEGTSIHIPHDRALESLNVGVAVSIALYERSR